MTIRFQIFLSISLLFLGVGAAGAAGARWLESQTVRQAFAEQTHSLAVAVASLTEAGDAAALRSGQNFGNTRLGQVWGRLQRWDIIKRFYVVDPATGRPLADTGGPDAVLPPEAQRPPEAGEVAALPLRTTADGHALQPLLATTPDGTVMVGIEIAADDFLAQLASIRRDTVVDAAIALFLGLAVAAALGLFAEGLVARLRTAVNQVGLPSFDARVADTGVREAAELVNTLGVMHSVLGETVEKGRQALTESDYYRSEAGLAAVYRRELLAPGTWAGAGAEAAWLPAGSPPHPGIAGAFALGETEGAAFAGLAPASGGLASFVRARAAGAYLADALARRPLAEAAADASGLFGLERLVVARWREGRLELWRSGAPAESPPWTPGAPLALSCLGPVNQDRLELYFAHFSGHAAAQLLAELPPLLQEAEPGLVLMLRRLA